MEKKCSSTYTLQSLDRALQLLFLFTEEKPELSLTEISRQMDMSNPVTLKYLTTLEQRGFLTRDEKTKRYALGVALMALGGLVRRSSVVNAAAYPIIQQLSETVGETVYLQVPLRPTFEAVVAAVVKTEKSVTSRFSGSCKLYAGASRKVLLAYLGEEYLARMLEHIRLTPYTSNTNIDPERLREELAQIRQQGYAISYAETVAEACGIAVPIFNADGIAASLMIYIPMYRVTDAILQEDTRHAIRAAAEITQALGGSVPQP